MHACVRGIHTRVYSDKRSSRRRGAESRQTRMRGTDRRPIHGICAKCCTVGWQWHAMVRAHLMRLALACSCKPSVCIRVHVLKHLYPRVYMVFRVHTKRDCAVFVCWRAEGAIRSGAGAMHAKYKADMRVKYRAFGRVSSMSSMCLI